MERDNQEKQNGGVTEETDDPSLDDAYNKLTISDNPTPIPNTITGVIPPPDSEFNKPKTTKSTDMSTEEFTNGSLKEEITSQVNNFFVLNTESSSNPPSSLSFTLQSSESDLPVITLTPVSEDNIESDSTEFLHYYITYNPDGTITAYPISPYDPESPALDHHSESQLPTFQVNLASDPLESQTYQFQDQESGMEVFARNNVPESQVFVQNEVPVSESNESSWETVDENNAQELQTQSSYPLLQENEKETAVYQNDRDKAQVYQLVIHDPVYQDVLINTPLHQDDQNNTPVYQDSKNNDQVYQYALSNAALYQDVIGNATTHENVQINTPLYPDVQRNLALLQDIQVNSQLYQDVQNDDLLYQDVQNNDLFYQDVQNKDPLYQDVQSSNPLHGKTSLHQDIQIDAPLHEDVQDNALQYQSSQSNSLTSLHDHDSDSEFEEQHEEGLYDDVSSYTTWHASHPEIGSRLVAAVRYIGWQNPDWRRLFQNRDKRFRRFNKPGARVNDNNISEILSHNGVKENDSLMKGISNVIQKESDRPMDSSKEKLNHTKLKVEDERKLSDSKLHLIKLENKSSKAIETETESIRDFLLPKLDIKSDIGIVIPKTLQSKSDESIDAMEKADRCKLKYEIRTKETSPLQLKIDASGNKNDVSSNSASTKIQIDIPKIQITDYDDKPNEENIQSRLDAQAMDGKAPEVKVAFIKPNTKNGMEQFLFSKNYVTLNGSTTLVESGAARKSTLTKVKNLPKTPPKNNIPPAVLRTIYRHKDTVQKFIGQHPNSDGQKWQLILSRNKAEIQRVIDQKPTIYRHENTVQKFIGKDPSLESTKQELILSADKAEIQQIAEQKPAIYRHKDTVQKFIGQDPSSEGPKLQLNLSQDKTEIQQIAEEKPTMEVTEMGSIETASKAGKNRKRRSRKKNVQKKQN